MSIVLSACWWLHYGVLLLASTLGARMEKRREKDGRPR